MIKTVGDLVKELAVYNQEIEVTVLTYAHNGQNGFGVGCLEPYKKETGKTGLAIIALGEPCCQVRHARSVLDAFFNSFHPTAPLETNQDEG
ncbi:MAG: hypothetical protein D9V46_12125 [Deltaproteobacteria bacterium]|uniref:hypothetical protein n=1 Tax=Hydrosulfovibrio ferrireducens TaxID=2934181 RepID=UPI00121C20A5|nr:MAG: hypothetical protein D9V46_12125 [Deltaproteobacteria bacterium]